MAGGADSIACFDSLSLEGPAYIPPTTTATPSATIAASATATPSPSSTSTAIATQSATPTRTATPPPSATVASAPTTSAPTSAGLSFSNGGFESGLSGWQKFGGELRAVASPHRSGGSAGALTSTTDSTKWAYQAVAIDASSAYRFSGYVRGEGSLSAAYLRISWYTSGDASGQALATDDSIGQLNGPSSDFVYLSTDAVSPPQGARSARLRVVMAPGGSAAATVYLDDFEFAPATVSAQATPRVEPTLALSTSAQGVEPPPPTLAPPSATQAAQATAALTSQPRLTPSPAASPNATGSPISEVESVARVQPTRSSLPVSAPKQEPPQPSPDSGFPVWPTAIVLGLASAGGAYIYTRRKQT